VDVSLSNNGFTATNTTVPGYHVFAGTITRSLINLNGRLVLTTRGVGTASILAGPRDYLNQTQGPRIFNTLDRVAADELARFFLVVEVGQTFGEFCAGE